ncbi:MAG: DMT family transporter [Ichthyobacteriaceae bacterium]|nr:DMT family transporter [Ichthyobacteriaceae bacterium]
MTIETNRSKGYLFAFLSTLAMSNVYIFSKSALNEISLPQFGFYWFATALVMLVAIMFYRGNSGEFKNITKQQYLKLAFIGVMETIVAGSFFMSINTIDNPAIVSFLGNMKPIFVITFGYFLLNEKYSGIEILGLLATLAGGVILGYKPNMTFQMLYDGGIIFILISMLVGTINMIFVRKNPIKVPSVIMSINRSFYLFMASVIFLFMSGESLSIPQSAMINVTLGSLLGPVLGSIASYAAIKNLEVGRMSLISTSKGIFVLIGAYFVFGKLPENIQLFGGFLTILGVVIITLSKKLKKKPKQ